MSVKAILYSLLALVLSAGILVATIFMFKVHFMLGIVGIALMFIPFKVQRKAIDETSGKIDEIIVKYVIPGLFLVAILFIVLSFTLWMK